MKSLTKIGLISALSLLLGASSLGQQENNGPVIYRAKEKIIPDNISYSLLYLCTDADENARAIYERRKEFLNSLSFTNNTTTGLWICGNPERLTALQLGTYSNLTREAEDYLSQKDINQADYEAVRAAIKQTPKEEKTTLRDYIRLRIRKLKDKQ